MSAQVCSAIESMGKDIISAFYSGNYVDIFSFIDFGDPRSKYLEYSGIVGVEPYAHDVVFPIKPCRFEGQEFPCPHQVEAYLKHAYGKAATPGLPKMRPFDFPCYRTAPCPWVAWVQITTGMPRPSNLQVEAQGLPGTRHRSAGCVRACEIRPRPSAK